MASDGSTNAGDGAAPILSEDAAALARRSSGQCEIVRDGQRCPRRGTHLYLRRGVIPEVRPYVVDLCNCDRGDDDGDALWCDCCALSLTIENARACHGESDCPQHGQRAPSGWVFQYFHECDHASFDGSPWCGNCMTAVVDAAGAIRAACPDCAGLEWGQPTAGVPYATFEQVEAAGATPGGGWATDPVWLWPRTPAAPETAVPAPDA